MIENIVNIVTEDTKEQAQELYRFIEGGVIRWYKYFSLNSFYDCVDNPNIEAVILCDSVFDYFLTHHYEKFKFHKKIYSKVFPELVEEIYIVHNTIPVTLIRSKYDSKMTRSGRLVSRGRPRKIDGTHFQDIKSYLQDGISKEHIAKLYHVSIRTLDRIFTKNKSFFTTSKKT